MLGSLADLRVRAMANVADVLRPGAEPWNILQDLGELGAKARPVVIQGGLSTDAYLYEPFERMLRARGFEVLSTPLDFHGYATIQRDAANLAKQVERASLHSVLMGGDGLVDIVGHSKGGLAARWYLQEMGGLEKVGQLVTIGTPHNGVAPLGRLTPVAMRSTAVESLRQLSTTSDEVTRLNRGLPDFMRGALELRPEFRITSIAGDMDLPGLRGSDGMVSVGAAHLPEGVPGLANLVYRGFGAHHGAVAGQFGMFEPTLRAATNLLGGRAVSEASYAAVAGARAVQP